MKAVAPFFSTKALTVPPDDCAHEVAQRTRYFPASPEGTVMREGLTVVLWKLSVSNDSVVRGTTFCPGDAETLEVRYALAPRYCVRPSSSNTASTMRFHEAEESWVEEDARSDTESPEDKAAYPADTARKAQRNADIGKKAFFMGFLIFGTRIRSVPTEPGS